MDLFTLLRDKVLGVNSNSPQKKHPHKVILQVCWFFYTKAKSQAFYAFSEFPSRDSLLISHETRGRASIFLYKIRQDFPVQLYLLFLTQRFLKEARF